MARLIERTPFRDLLPLNVEGAALTAVDLGPLWSVAPFSGKSEAVDAALTATHGVTFPGPGQTARSDKARIIWAGLGQALLAGERPDLGEDAAVTAQADGYATACLAGPLAEDVLARLVPLDLRAAAFPQGGTARTLVGHMTASVTRVGPDSFELMVLRSMAATLCHDVGRAMSGVAARAANDN